MKPEVLLELIEAAADQLGIRVSYETLQSSVVGNGLRGGLCKVKAASGMQWRVIIDKRAATDERIQTLATAVAGFDTSELELSDKVREVLRTYEGTRPAGPESHAPRPLTRGPRRAA